MARGDHIRVRRRGYWHHGIDCGDGTVIHYDGELFRVSEAAVRRVAYEAFAKGGKVRRVKDTGAYDPDTILSRAESRIGECGYSALLNNCEHFARWCVNGVKESRQVERVLYAATGLALTAAGVLATVIVARTLGGRSGGPGTS